MRKFFSFAVIALIFFVGLFQENHLTGMGRKSLLEAVEGRDLGYVKVLLKSDVVVNEVDKHGKTPLFLACKKNNPEIVKLLLPKCTKDTINKTNEYGQTPLYWACYNNNLKMIELLLPRCTKEKIIKGNLL